MYVIEANPRASRTVPFVSKATGVPLAKVAARVMAGERLADMGLPPDDRELGYCAVKEAVMPFGRFPGSDVVLGPEMKSTGEVLGIAETFEEALYKAFLGAGIDIPKHRQVIITVKDADKGEAIGIGRRFEALGYTIYATRSTADALNEAGVHARKVNKIHQESPTIMDLILGHKIDLVIDTPTHGRDKTRDGFLIRRVSIETGVHCLTSLETADALLTSLEAKEGDKPRSLVDITTL